MILQFNYEELTALKAGATGLLREGGTAGGGVLAPPEHRARVEALVGRLDGDVSLDSLAEVIEVRDAIQSIVAWLRQEMESSVLATHPADESAVAAYFDFAHAFTVSHRVTEMAHEMSAMIELITGAPPNTETSRDIHFPD